MVVFPLMMVCGFPSLVLRRNASKIECDSFTGARETECSLFSLCHGSNLYVSLYVVLGDLFCCFYMEGKICHQFHHIHDALLASSPLIVIHPSATFPDNANILSLAPCPLHLQVFKQFLLVELLCWSRQPELNGEPTGMAPLGGGISPLPGKA